MIFLSRWDLNSTWSLCSVLNINDNYDNAIKYSVHLGALHTFIIVNYNMRINRFECIFVVQFEQITGFAAAHTRTHSDTFIQMAESINWMHHWILDRLVVPSIQSTLCWHCSAAAAAALLRVCMCILVSLYTCEPLSHLISRVSKCTTVIGLTLRVICKPSVPSQTTLYGVCVRMVCVKAKATLSQSNAKAQPQRLT